MSARRRLEDLLKRRREEALNKAMENRDIARGIAEKIEREKNWIKQNMLIPKKESTMEADPKTGHIIGIGDMVFLKSGGPQMTVTDLDFGGKVSCAWFDNNNNVHSYEFPLDALQRF